MNIRLDQNDGWTDTVDSEGNCRKLDRFLTDRIRILLARKG